MSFKDNANDNDIVLGIHIGHMSMEIIYINIQMNIHIYLRVN